MVLNLLLGAVAGFFTPMAEPHIRAALSKLALAEIPVGETEFDVLSLLTLLIGASVLVAILGGNSMAFPLLLGALGGLFGKRFVAAIKGRSSTAQASATQDTAENAAPEEDNK